jgi:hypothetical protein
MFIKKYILIKMQLFAQKLEIFAIIVRGLKELLPVVESVTNVFFFIKKGVY